MIKTTLDDITKSMEAIGLLLGAQLPAKAAYGVSKLARACRAEMDDYEQRRRKIFEEAGCTVKDNNFVHGDATVLAAAIKEVAELQSSECEINALPLDIEQFKEAEIPGNAFFNLDWAMKPTAA